SHPDDCDHPERPTDGTEIVARRTSGERRRMAHVWATRARDVQGGDGEQQNRLRPLPEADGIAPPPHLQPIDERLLYPAEHDRAVREPLGEVPAMSFEVQGLVAAITPEHVLELRDDLGSARLRSRAVVVDVGDGDVDHGRGDPDLRRAVQAVVFWTSTSDH